ncbi:hypothetical protein [Vibrio breoganii]|uniref:hypothetical protein n=1 Tax=Vibrio breoganii TaxID=553239 RepID=UPI000C819CBA|nr:hypothetical protein [Vibrio breoganii]PMG96022.1 hypothetical protein BCU79_09045 [Vibrio breoganii]
MLLVSIRAATHEPAIRFKTDTTEARQRVVNLTVAEVRKKAEQGETVAQLTLDHVSNAQYQLVDWLLSYFEKEGFRFGGSLKM